MTSYRFLVNPTAGSGSAAGLVDQVAARLRAAGATVAVETSLSPEHSKASVAEAVAAGQVVVAAGGDGMLASVAGSVVDARGVLGVVPGGRGNDFARMLGLPSEPPAIAQRLLEARSTPVDVIGVDDGHVVLGSMYAGVDSLASEIVDASRRLPSAVQYPYAAVRSLLTYKPGRFTVTVDGSTTEHDAYTVVVANSAYYGKGMRIAPAADVRDGLLDVVVLPAGSRFGMVRRLPKVYDGSHVDLPGVVVLRGRSVTVAAEHEVVAYGDGERLGPLPRTATVRPGALQVLA
ncbi:diacylglycerol/lipid kinase family protein [Nocardioides caldifontis]|uniref:diacylglycerol/lipid kinase family protein n=1 Tax=Nocardioides caldifontis TaxID=2588938 RepID=UPI0011E03D90|nr:diacylglycerol kinase family protein [Nocardioides caldifontis]